MVLRKRKVFPNFSSPPRLFWIATDSILSHLTKLGSQYLAQDHHYWVQDLLDQLPRAVRDHLLKEAELTLDSPMTVDTLLAIWISCMKNPFRHGTITTPRYLCNSKHGRLLILNHLLKVNSNTVTDQSTQCLALNMYSFYQHPNFYRKKLSEDLSDNGAADASLLLDNDEHFLLCRTIELFKFVETLILPSVCDDASLYVIATNCKSLKMLDVSFSSNVTDLGVSASFENDLCICNSLEQIFLEGTNITPASVLLLLNKQTKLEVLESSHLSDALKILAKKFVEQKTTKLSLKKLSMSSNHRDRSTSPYNLLHLFDLCPRINDVTLPNIQRQLRLDELTKLPNLSHLYLGEIPLNQLASTLEKTGPSLKSLRYTNFIEFVDVDFVLRSCPNLETIGISAGCLIHSARAQTIWPNLKCIYLNVHALISRPIWEKLFFSCPALEYLDMTPGDAMTDSAIRDICQRYSSALTSVKTFVVRGRHCSGDVSLSEKTIQFLSTRCKHLNVVGNCVTWSISSQSSQRGDFIYLEN